MKTYLFLSALSLVMSMTACQKDNPLTPTVNKRAFLLATDDRCGCLPPVEFDVRNTTDVSADLHWNTMPEATAYRVEVSSEDLPEAGDVSANVHIFEVTEDNQLSLTGLNPGTQYQYRVTTLCRSMESYASETMYFETIEPVSGDPGYHPAKAYEDH
ncbi:MAG: hypothetical protein EPGJADBJ_01279 [Saprospiraceae bacterium]|nr:hypothetical protein [Saprospiraceae bacterium]